MKTTILSRPWRAAGYASSALRGVGAALLSAFLLAPASLLAASTTVQVSTLTGGPFQFNSPPYGYVDGDTAAVAQFHTPIGLAMDSTGNYLFVADRDNNAIRVIDLGAGETYTYLPIVGLTPPGAINNPVGVAVDADDNVYVLNRGNGNDGSLVRFDYYGDLVGTNATGLTDVSSIALDSTANAYVTAGNSLIKITPGGVKTTVATVTDAGAALQGLVVMDSGIDRRLRLGPQRHPPHQPDQRRDLHQHRLQWRGRLTTISGINNRGPSCYQKPYRHV